MPFDGRNYTSRQPIRKTLHTVHQVLSGSLWGHALRNAYAFARHHAEGMHCFSWPRPIQVAAYFDDAGVVVASGAGTPQRIYPWRHYVAAHFTHARVHFVFSIQAESGEAELQLTAGTDASPAQDVATITVPCGTSSPYRIQEPIADPFLQGGRYEAIVELPLINAVGPGRRLFQLFGRGVGSALRPDSVSAWLASEG